MMLHDVLVGKLAVGMPKVETSMDEFAPAFAMESGTSGRYMRVRLELIGPQGRNVHSRTTCCVMGTINEVPRHQGGGICLQDA